jgi:hypothetical protein
MGDEDSEYQTDMQNKLFKENILEVETRLATRIRQCFRAVAVQDNFAVRDEITLIIHCLQRFLDVLLTFEPTWNSQDRWFDDMIHVQHELIPPSRFRIAGELVWGLREETGPQWVEPFYADVTITEGRNDSAAYCIRFARRDDDAKLEIKFGFYPGPGRSIETISDPWDGWENWKYKFNKNDEPNESTSTA